jgi:nitrous oxide reductase accessory protein NosL
MASQASLDPDGRFGKGAVNTVVGGVTGGLGLLYNVGGGIGYAATSPFSQDYANETYGSQVQGLENTVNGIGTLGSQALNGQWGNIGTELTGGANQSTAYRFGAGAASIGMIFAGGGLGDAGEVGDVADVADVAGNVEGVTGDANFAAEVTSSAPKFVRCFPPGTKVLMADGSTKSIEKIEEGDEVLATDPTTTKKPGPLKVVDLIRNHTEHLVAITVRDSSGKTAHFQATREHPFWVKGMGWTLAKDLVQNDLLTDKNGQDVYVLDVKIKDKQSPTYNLTIDQKHTFYIVDNGVTVLVHNASPFQVGTYGSLTGGANVGDGLAAHEVLPNAYLEAIGFNTTGARLAANPSIALSSDIHLQINAMQSQWGIQNADYLSTLTPEEVISINHDFMIQAGVPEDAALEVSQNAVNYVNQLGIECP